MPSESITRAPRKAKHCWETQRPPDSSPCPWGAWRPEEHGGRKGPGSRSRLAVTTVILSKLSFSAETQEGISEVVASEGSGLLGAAATVSARHGDRDCHPVPRSLWREGCPPARGSPGSRARRTPIQTLSGTAGLACATGGRATNACSGVRGQRGPESSVMRSSEDTGRTRRHCSPRTRAGQPRLLLVCHNSCCKIVPSKQAASPRTWHAGLKGWACVRARVVEFVIHQALPGSGRGGCREAGRAQEAAGLQPGT